MHDSDQRVVGGQWSVKTKSCVLRFFIRGADAANHVGSCYASECCPTLKEPAEGNQWQLTNDVSHAAYGNPPAYRARPECAPDGASVSRLVRALRRLAVLGVQASRCHERSKRENEGGACRRGDESPSRSSVPRARFGRQQPRAPSTNLMPLPWQGLGSFLALYPARCALAIE